MLSGVRGYVLAGGESSRMQHAGLPVDKAMLMWQGRTLLDHAADTLRQVCESYRILCGNAERCARLGLHDSGICDRTPVSGPLGGLEAALADAEEAAIPWVLLLPVDLPWLPAEALMAFGHRALGIGSAAVCMQSEGVVQPLPALVSSAAAPLIRDRLQSGERKLLPTLQVIANELTPEVSFQPIVAETLLDGSDSTRWFWNVNTPQDYHLLQEHETLRTGPHQSTHAAERATGRRHQ